MSECVFCSLKEGRIAENSKAFAVYDINPKTKGHALIISKRHVENFFSLEEEELGEMFKLLKEVKNILQEKYSPKAFNVIVNIGKEAGQIVMHVHMHLIPRY